MAGDKTRCMKGYMTVEAALVLSIVFMVYLFLIQSCLWMYDRCVLEQDMAALALRCVNGEAGQLERVWQQELADWDREKYLWTEPQEPEIKKQGWKLTITGKSKDIRQKDYGITYEVWQLTPEDWLRGKQWLENKEVEQ